MSREKINDILSDQLGERPFTEPDTATLHDDLGMDELDIIEVVMEIESEFDIEVSDEQVEALQTVGDIMALVDAK